jgi:predicted dehydrogenase
MDITIGLLGCGLWGQNILRDLLQLGCRVIVVEPNGVNGRCATALGAHDVVASDGRMSSVQGIVVATPASTHAAVVEQILDRGVPIFVEKPFTTDTQSAVRLAELAPDRLFVMHIWRYHPGVELLGTIARSEELGPITMVRTVRTNWTSPRRDTDSLWTLVPHDLSIAAEILGTIPTPRFAVADTPKEKPLGLIAVLGDHPSFVLEVSNRYPDKRREVRVHCRDGVAVLPSGDGNEVEITRNSDVEVESGTERRSFSAEPPLRRELADFLQHLRGGPPPKSNAAEGLAVVRAIAHIRVLANLTT